MMVGQSPNVKALIMNVHNEFLGAWDHYTTQARKEYLSMRCCSYKRKDLETHYERMSKWFYAINGIDDINLKQLFLIPSQSFLRTKHPGSFKSRTYPSATLHLEKERVTLFGKVMQSKKVSKTD